MGTMLAQEFWKLKSTGHKVAMAARSWDRNSKSQEPCWTGVFFLSASTLRTHLHTHSLQGMTQPKVGFTHRGQPGLCVMYLTRSATKPNQNWVEWEAHKVPLTEPEVNLSGIYKLSITSCWGICVYIIPASLAREAVVGVA